MLGLHCAAAVPPFSRSQSAALIDTRPQITDGAKSAIPACRFWDTGTDNLEHVSLDAVLRHAPGCLGRYRVWATQIL